MASDAIYYSSNVKTVSVANTDIINELEVAIGASSISTKHFKIIAIEDIEININDLPINSFLKAGDSVSTDKDGFGAVTVCRIVTTGKQFRYQVFI